MLYSDLTTSQQEQAQRDLYHDALFNVDSNQFDYILDGDMVTGRIPHTLAKDVKPARNQPITLASTVATVMTEDTHFRIDCAINDLARLVALSLVGQLEEINVS